MGASQPRTVSKEKGLLSHPQSLGKFHKKVYQEDADFVVSFAAALLFFTSLQVANCSLTYVLAAPPDPNMWN